MNVAFDIEYVSEEVENAEENGDETVLVGLKLTPTQAEMLSAQLNNRVVEANKKVKDHPTLFEERARVLNELTSRFNDWEIDGYDNEQDGWC